MANDTNRRRKFYDQMSESYDLGSFEEFDKKMNDAASRKRLHEFIDKDGKYDIGTFEYFDEAMRPANEPSSSGMIASTVAPQTESSAKYLTRIGGSEQGLPEGVFYSDEVMKRHGSPKNRKGNYKDLSQIAREVAAAGDEAYTTEDRPSPLRPKEPKIELPFMQGATEREDLKHSPNLNKYWANAQQEAARRAMEAKPTAQDFEYRMEGWEEAAKADAIRKANRGEFDKQHQDEFNELYKNHVAPAFKEERAAGEQRARKQVNKMLEQPKVPDNPAMATSGFQNAFNTAVISERETDPAKIAEATIKRVQQDDAFGDYVLKRMGISDQGGNQGESEPLSEREKKFMQLLFSRETSEVADQLIQRMYDQYKEAGAPKNALEYIAGKAFHENMMASLFDAMVRRVAGSSGMRQQLRAMASEEYGDEASFTTRMLGGAAPFAVDLATGAFTLPSIAGGIASRGLMRGGAKILSRQVTKELEKRAAARGLEDAALREAASGGADIAERYLATQSPIMNIAVRSVGSAANFGTYDVQNGLIRQFGEGEFDAGELFKEAVHGAMLGGVMGVAGGSIANATRNSGLAGRIAGDIAGITSEVGIFAAANGIQKAMDEGISITDVDWADTTGEALGMVAGMKLAGMVSHPSRELFHRYQKSKDFGMQLNQRDIDELKQAGYDFDGIFQGLGQFGKIAPVSKTITRGMEGVPAKSTDQTNREAYIDTTAYNELMKNPNIASSTKRKIAYIATGQVLSVEPAFSVVMNNDNGHITITTKNVFGNIIETRDYTSEKEAQRDYDIQKAASRINTIDGLERVAAQSGYPDVISSAKDKTMEETGINVDDALMGRVVDKHQSDLALDTYVRNLSDAYNSRYSRALEDATGMVDQQPEGESGDGAAPQRTERRQNAYERGKSVSVDEGQLADIGYESQLSEARLMQLMPDGEQSGIIRQQIMDALDTGDIEAAETILQRQSPYLNEQQRAAIDDYIDTFETSFGVDDAVSEMTEDYEQQRREELSAISDDHGNITRLVLKDGTEAYYQAGDLNGFHSQVIVTNDQGEARQISSSDIQEVVPSVSAEDVLSDDVRDYSESLRERYQLLSQGNMLLDGQQTDIAIGNQLFRVTNAGQDDNGNYYLQMPDGSQMPMTPQQLSQSIAAAKDFKIQQELAQERQADVLRQRTERFIQGIVGYEQGTPDLTAKDTKPEVAAEFLLAATGPDGEPVDRKTVLDNIQTHVDQLNTSKQQMQAALQQARNDMAMADDGEADAVRQRTEQLESQLSAIDAQRRKWGEIRQAMMTDEERQAFEKDRIKAVAQAQTQSKKDAEPVGEPTGTVAIPSKEDVVAQYPERTDGEAFVEEQRKQLSQTYKNDVFPQYDDIQKTLGDYQHGLIDLTADEIKALTDQSARLSMQMDALVAQQNEWKKLSSDLGREYGKKERENMNPHDLAMSRLQNETDKTKKIKLAQEAFKDDEMALNVLDNLEPQDINEFVAANLGAGSINWEGLQRGEHYVRGLRDELGKDKTRGIGAKYDTNAYNQFLAPEGQGKGIDEIVHSISEGSPYDPQDVKNALLTMLSEATKPTDISHYIENSRIAEAERIYEANLQRERDAELEAEDEAIRQMTGMEPDEYDAFMGDLEQRLAEQEGYRTSEEYFKNILEDERAREERSLGGSQEASAVGLQRQEGDKAGASQEGQGGTGEADEQLKKVNKDIDVLSRKYNSLAPVEAVDSRNLTDEQIQDIAGQQLTTEEIEEGRELLRNAKTPSFYSPFSKKIYIFADKYNPDETEEWFFHENVHRGLDQYYGDNPIEVAEAFWNTESPTKPEVTAKHKEAIQRVYADKDEATQHEEYLVHMLGHYMTTGKVDRLLERMSPEHQEIIENILKNVKYDTAKENVERGGSLAESPEGRAEGESELYSSRRRNPEEAVQLEGGNEEDALQQEGGDTGRGVSKSSIQGLEDYSEDEIKDIVRNFVETQIADAEADAQIVDMKIIGSRTTGTAKPDSDLDVLLEYTGREREDGFFNLLHDADEPLVINGITIDINPITKGKSGTIAEFLERNKDYDTTKGEDLMHVPFADRLQAAKGETNVNPTEEQKKAGNYKMGHIRFGGYRMSIENPKGSTRSGVDKNGQPWSIEIQDSYGYIGQKYGTDGDHLDFFINDDADLDTWNGRVYVVDQKNEDGTFDEHKVMYGYPTFAAAKRAYERNYEPGWWDKHVMQMTGMKKENFDQWLSDSDHKRKPFADYSRTRQSDTVSSNVDQLLSDIKAREEAEMKPQQTQHILRASELEGKSADELRQLRKKEMQDRSMAKVLLGTTDAVKDTEKERILQDNIMRAEVNIKSIDEALKKQADAFRQHAEQMEIGGAMVDRLEDMGFEVSTNPRENRRIRKIAEKDNSEEGKMRHFETRDGQIYGFTFKGKMYLDVTKIDAELPIHEYAHPWCEAFRRLNPEGWKNIVDLMKGDKDTWDFIKSINPDLKSDDDIAEEMIAKFSGKKGEERARAEYERMNGKDPEYKSKWGNIWQNISKAIQDFWKQVGDFLHIKYKSAEQVYDQVVRDFANKINPRKRVEDWLKERDQEYLDAVKQGDEAKAKELFDAALRENIGNGITPFVAVDGYRGKMQKLAHGVKTRDSKVIAQVADLMAPLIPKDAVLVPAPSHTGKATDMLDLANAISERTGAPVADVLTSGERDSQYEAKYAGRPLSASEMGIVAAMESLPAGKIPVVIDNVVDTGNTAEACVQALGKGIVASLANSVGRYKRVASLKSAEPVVTDKNGEVVPLSKRFELGRKADVTRQHAGQVMPEFMIEEGNLFDNEDFEEPATIVNMSKINKYGLNEASPIGKKLTDLKQQAGEKTIVGYVDSESGNYVVLGNDAALVEKAAGGRGITTGMQDGMPSVTIVSDFDILSPRMVRDGYKFAFTTDETAPVKEEPKAEPTEQPVTVKDTDSLMQEVEHRQKVAEAKADKKAAEDAVKKFLARQPKNEEEKIRQRATKAVLKTLDKAGVPYKVVSKEEENQMMKLFSMMNQEAVKAFARRVDIRSQQPHGVGKYCVYNMNNPFGVPIYAEKLSVAKFQQEQLQRMVPDGEWAILNIGYPDETVDNNELRNAADMNVGDLQAMIGWHGSGAIFTKFDHSHIGEGAGSQTFGWGTYLSNGRGIGESYADSLSKGWSYDGRHLNDYKPIFDGSPNRTSTIRDILSSLNLGHSFDEAVNQERRHIESAIRDYEEEIDDLSEADKKDLDTYKTELEFVNSLKESDFEPDVKVLYKVEIPDENEAHYLKWQWKMVQQNQILEMVDNALTADGWKRQEIDTRTMFTKNGEQIILTPNQSGADLYAELESALGSSKAASDFLHKVGVTGVKYPAGTIWGGGDGATNYVIFNEDDAKITDTIQFMIGDESDNGPVFISNALQAVEGIKQEKGTAEQWLAMIQKNGGLKAGEDKWLGLSEWLNEHKGEKLTKQDVLDFIRQNQVQVEETHYSEFDEEGSRRLANFNKEFDSIIDKLEKERNAVNAEAEAFNQEMYEKYGQGWANDRKQLSKEDRQRDRHISNRYSFLNDNDLDQLAFADMVEKYGDDFGDAFEVNYNGDHYELIPTVDFYDEPTEAAKRFLHTQNVINGTRLVYTTDGLDHKREIALTVPTIEPYNESDSIHFGDAGGGRAVAWIRFGDTVIEQGNSVGHQAAKRRMDAYYDYLVDKYGKDLDPLEFSAKLTPEESAEMSRLEAEYDKTFDEGSKKVLVIDEIQSKRHQDAREQGGYEYNDSEKAWRDSIDRKADYLQSLYDKYPSAKHYEELEKLATPEEVVKVHQLEIEERELYNKYLEDRNKVPAAPFEKNWHELAMKRMLRYAAENGYDKIAWTTGEQQAERYSLSKSFDSIEREDNPSINGRRFVFSGNNVENFVVDDQGKVIDSTISDAKGKDLSALVGKDMAVKLMGMENGDMLEGENLRIGGEGMKGFYDEILPRFMNKYGKKWGVKVGEVELPGLEKSAQKMWSIDVTPEMKESVMQGQPMFQKEGKRILGWSDGKQVYLTEAGLNPNTPVHECTHLWDKWCMKEQPELWKKLVAAMKKTAMWEEISKNPNYRNIWNDEDRMASEVHSRLSGAQSEEEFTKAAFKKDTPQGVINEVKSILRKFWERILQLFGKHSKTIGSDWDSLDAIVRMPLRDLINEDFEKVMRVAGEDAVSSGDLSLMEGDVILKTLMGVHNISEDKLKKAIKQGGLANPSLAVIDTKGGYVHTDYGGISLIPKASLIDSKTGRNAGTFTADAWTPSYPPVELVMKNKGWDKFFADLKDIRKNADGGDELASRLRVYIESYLEQRDPDAMYWWYMYDRGLNPATVRRTNPYNETLTNRVVELTGGDERTSVGSLSDDVIKEIAELYHNYKTANKEELKPLGERISYTKQRINPEDTNKMRQLRLQEILDDLEKYGETKSNLNNFISSINLSARRAGEVDDYTTFSDARKAVMSQGKEADFQKWLEELNARYGIEEKIFNGWTNNGDKKYIPNTLENVSRYMKRQGLNGATNWSSMGSWIATVANKEKTLEGIRKHRKNLGTPEAEHDAFHEKWGEIFFPIVQKLGKGDVFNGDNVMKDILEHTDFAGYLKREYGMELTKEEKESIDTFIKEVRTNFPTGYFETKFERPVMLDEFEIAVVPENTSPDVVEALKNAGLDVRTYDNTGSLEQQTESRRVAVMNAVGMRNDILFHIEDDDDTVARLEREPKEIGYRNVVLNDDGSLGSPMANRLGKKGVGRKATTPFEYGKWERSDEHPELATEDGKIDLIKPGNKEVGGVDYNPYIHIRPNKVNKQFKQAWERPNLIYVETEYPKSELEGNYQAEKAALPVGKHPWGGGELILSRWDKPIRMVPWEEVADDWEKEFAGRGVEFDIVPPKLLPILAERGVEILPPHKGMGKACNEAYEAWKEKADVTRQHTGQELLRRGEAAIEAVNAKFNKDLESLNDKSVLMLGSPSQVLLSTGIKNKPMKLYGTKLIAKAKKHGYEPADIKNLPSAVASPLAVFTGSHPDSFAILTVLKIKGNNVLVSISPTNDVNDVDFNIISSVYDKKANSVLRWINEGKGLYYDKEKALTYLRHSTPIVETTDKQELDSAAKIVNSFENPKLSDEKIHEIYPEYTEAGDATAEQLGGVGVIWEQQTMEPGTKGWYNPNDNTVHVAIDEVEDVDDVKRTVCHEKLGHEGLVALLGSQAAVNKFGSFVFGSASKAIRQRIMEKADEIDPQWTKHDRFSKAAQEVLADIAADGPKTADEFALWTKVKHYLIRFLNKIGLKIRGLLNDHDLSYYILKTGEALKRWDKMSDKEKADMMQQSTGQEILRSRRGKPRKRNNESDAQYFQRLTAWEKWRNAVQRARENGDPEPTEDLFHQQAEADFKAAMEQWRRDNNIGENESFNQPFPRRNPDETPQEYAVRVADFESQHDLWATAPQYMDFISRANEKYRRAYTEWRERYDLQEEASVDQRLYEGDIDPEPTYTDAEVEAREMAEKEIADELGYEIDEEGAKRMAKLAVIERRKNFESANAEDAIWVYDFMKQTDAVAKQIAERTGQKVTGKEIREALPFLIEADRRKENMDAEREDAIMAINMSEAIQQAHSFVDYYNLDEIGDELKALNDAWQHQEAEPDVRAKQAYREAAARLAEKLNSLNADKAGYNPLFADDVMQIRSLLTSAAVSGNGAIMPEHAERFADMPEMQPLMEHVKEWYDEFFQVLEDAGLRGDAGYIEEGYVNHVWDKEKSDASAWEKYIENRQRTKSPNMRHREIDTYMDGISVGLVPKYTDIADMIAHYSRQNNEAVANSKFLDDLKFVYVQELNDAGEVVAILPLLKQEKPDAMLRDHYAQYYVPGVGDVYVMKPVQKRFANIFGTMRTPDAAEWLSKLGKAYDLTSSTAKKIQLALSGFHALALFEVDVAQNNPAVALKHLLKYIVGDSFKSGTLPAYAHPEDFQLAAKHLVQLGATEDYAAADVNAITARIRETFKALGESDEVWKKAAGVAGSPAAIFMDWINKGFDTVLWNYLHDGLKLSAFKQLVKQVDARVEKEGLDDKMREQLLDEAGQYVNDMFGGQYWELLNISPATLKWMRRLFLSPDWLLSTQRHFFANFGIGSVYSDGGFREYIKYNWDNIKRVFGSDVPREELRRLRSKNAKYCYLVGALVWWHVFYNAINALCRWLDEEDEKEKAEEERKTNPAYKSPYELAYPNGMKWYDYTMWGNTIGQQTHLFTGRYSDGTETYVRWGKQFREFPELFMGRHGIEFPAPLIQRMMSKANPNIGTAIDFLGAQNIGGFNGSYENKELREKYGKTIATLAATARHFIPFGMPTQAEKEYKLMDFFMPSSKGFSRWKAKDYFETFILDGDWDGIEATYQACVMNGVDAEKNLDAAIASIKAAQKKELADGIVDLTTAAEKFDAATTPEQRKLFVSKLKKQLKGSEYKAFTKQEAIEKVQSFLDGGEKITEKDNAHYLMQATSEDIIAEERLKDLGRKAKQYIKAVDNAPVNDQEAMEKRFAVWFDIDAIVSGANSDVRAFKKEMNGKDDKRLMDDIRKTIRDAQSEIDKLDAPK